MENTNYCKHLTDCTNDISSFYCLQCENIHLVSKITYSDATSVLVELDNPSPTGAMFRGTGLFLGAMLIY